MVTLTKNFLPEDPTHKHKFKITGVIKHDGKHYTTATCSKCSIWYHFERGWFQHNNWFAKEKV